MSAPQPARAADLAWTAGGLAGGAPVASTYIYEPTYGGPYYPYEWSYSFRVGYGFPYGARYIHPYPYAYDYPARYADPYNYRSTYAWAGPPCYVSWARGPAGWRKARICD